MIHVKKIATCAMIAAGLAVSMVPGAHADAISKFYKGKVVTLIVSAGGGTYTLIARTMHATCPIIWVVLPR